MSTRDAYRLLGYWNLAKAASRGPKALARALWGRATHRQLAKVNRELWK